MTAALADVRRAEPAVVTLDLGLPPDPDGVSEGLATLEQILALAPDTKVIVVTGNDERDNAVRAVGLGAYDFYQKPVDEEHAAACIVGARFHLHALGDRESPPDAEARERGAGLPVMITASAQDAVAVRARSRKSRRRAPDVLHALGESGTGKELLARALARA